MRCKSNKNLEFIKARKKSYVFIQEKGKDIGIFMWNYTKKKWVFESEK